MDTVARQLLDLMQLAGIPQVTFPLRYLKYHRDNPGLITIEVNQAQCLAITLIEAFGINFSATATVAITNSSDTLARRAQPLETVVGTPELFVFPPGKAIFTFVFSALPLQTARVQVCGFRLPKSALNKLTLIATEQVAQ